MDAPFQPENGGRGEYYASHLFPARATWENYVYAFKKAPFLIYFRNSVIVTVVCVACTQFSTILAAFAFSRLKFPGRDILFSLLLP